RAVPVVANGRVYTFGAEGRLSAVDLATGRLIWTDETKRFGVRKGFFGAAGSPVVEDGRVIANIGGTLAGKDAGIVAFNANTGTVKWSVDNYHGGTVTLAGDRLLILRETGELVMAAATPEAYRPMAHAQILPATARSYPALADGFLYARNNDTHKDMLVCFD